jgi:cytochrome b6-f complex iron-sulfur subunit
MSCTRRVVLQTLGVGAAGRLMSACGDSGGNATAGSATLCGNDLCMSLAENPELSVTGGVVFVAAAGRKLFVMRTSDTELRAVSAICTHQGCTVAWDEGSEKLVCPCHGSQFTAAGAVTRGPALSALRTYPATLAGDQITIAP